MKRILLIVVVFPLWYDAFPQQTLDKFSVKHLQQSTNPHISKHAYVLSGSVWRDTHTLYVCWENPSPQAAGDMRLVQQAVSDSWQAVANLDFTGWEKCAPSNAGIRISIDDSGPHTKGLGRHIDGLQNGMVLNFDFNNWSPACRNMHEYCVYDIAVHEFGHAIGFAHEQNRPDAPGECQAIKQGGNGDLLLTPYDPKSVMNYCNREWNNNGHLSPLDISAVQELYGKRS